MRACRTASFGASAAARRILLVVKDRGRVVLESPPDLRQPEESDREADVVMRRVGAEELRAHEIDPPPFRRRRLRRGGLAGGDAQCECRSQRQSPPLSSLLQCPPARIRGPSGSGCQDIARIPSGLSGNGEDLTL